MFKGGYTGKVLRINLTDETAKWEETPEQLAKDYIGGAGFGIKYHVTDDDDTLNWTTNSSLLPVPFPGPQCPAAAEWPLPRSRHSRGPWEWACREDNSRSN